MIPQSPLGFALFVIVFGFVVAVSAFTYGHVSLLERILKSAEEFRHFDDFMTVPAGTYLVIMSISGEYRHQHIMIVSHGRLNVLKRFQWVTLVSETDPKLNLYDVFTINLDGDVRKIS